MKTRRYTLGLLVTFLLMTVKVFSYDFKSGGINYNVTEGNNVAVTSGDANYEGNIVIPEIVTYNGKNYNVTSIGNRAFYYCRGLTSITIPSSVTSIGYSAFYYCHGLTSITIPSSVTSIGDNAFYGCSGLLSVISEIQTPFEIARNVFSSETYIEASLNVPEGKRSAYQSTSCWNNFRIIKETSGSETKRDNLTWSSVSPAQGTLNELPQSINIIYKEFVNAPKKKTYIYGDVKNFPDQVPFQPGAWDAAAMRFNSYEGAHFPTISDDVYFSLKTLIFDVSDVSEDFDMKVMDGWWSNTYYDHVKWQSGSNELQITDDMAVECAKGGGGHDLDLMLYSGSCTINSVYYEDKEEVTFYKNGVKQFTGHLSIMEENSKSVMLSHQHGVIADEGVWTIKVPERFIYNGMMGNVDDERWNPAFTLTYIVQSTTEENNTSTKRTIHVAKAGSLPDSISDSEKYTIEELTLTGELNGTDFRLLRDMAGNNYLGQNTSGRLKVLDLANAKIVVGGEKYLDANSIKGNGVNASGSFHYNISQANFIPEYVFYGCNLNTIYIPNSVTNIGERAFYGCHGITSIMIPNSVTNIGNFAFYSCSGLTSITIPNSVTNIGNFAFEKCSGLTSITIPNSVTNVGYSAFKDCSGLTSITIPNSVIDIGDNAFSGCSGLTSITIPNSVTNIGSSAFYSCSGLTSISIPNSVTSIGNYAFYSCSGLTSITIPNSVTNIGSSAFEKCSGLTSITIPNSVTNIGTYAFYSCSGLTSIAISNSVTSIGTHAFLECSGLISIKVESGNKKYDSRNSCNAIIESSSNTLIVGCKNTTIPNSVTSIGNFAFSYCRGLTSISIPNSVRSIGYDAFRECSGLTSISIPNSVTNIGYSAFQDCSGLTSITIPNSVTDIGDNAFSGCSGLTSITIPNSVTSIGNYAFSSCSGLTSIAIPNSVTSIGKSAFRGCSGLTSITIPSSVTSIGDDAFYNCSGLTSISIPNSVTSIGNYAFYRCSGLKDIISEIKTPFEINEKVFSVYSTATLTVPYGTKSAYQSTAGWNKFTNIVEKQVDNIIQGDANGDKEVNVSDIVEVINFIMDNPSAIFLKANADLNGDGEVNVTDIVMMVSIIMSGQTGSAHTMSNRVGSITDADCLTIDDMSINAGETKQVSIGLNNPDKKYTAFQFDLTLPEGITIAKNSNGKLMASLNTERKDDHTLNVSELGNNTYRLLAFSMSNAELYGTNGALVNITLEADANMDSGTNAAALKSQVFTATDGTQYKWSDLPFSILVNRSENTGIDEISQNGQKSSMIKVYALTGLLLFSIPQSEFSEKWQYLPSGVYIVNGQKMMKVNDSK